MRKRGLVIRSNVRNLYLNREIVPSFWTSIFRELKNLGPWKHNANCLIFVSARRHVKGIALSGVMAINAT